VVHTLLYSVKVTNFCFENFGIDIVPVFAPSKEVSVEGQGLTAVEKYSIKMQLVLLR
jgi:aconitate hydratase 2/2-methylisocitrate dehydratase